MSEFALQIDNLKKTYKGGTIALKGISLKVKKGDFLNTEVDMLARYVFKALKK